MNDQLTRLGRPGRLRWAYILAVIMLVSSVTVEWWLNFWASGGESLIPSYYFVRSPAPDAADSWSPMWRAWDTLENEPRVNFYTQWAPRHHLKLNYPPTSLVLLAPFKGLTLESFVAYGNMSSWVALFALALVVSLIFIWSCEHYCAPLPLWHYPFIGAFSLLVTISFYPVMRAFYLGQVQIELDLLMALLLLAWLKGHNGLAGCLLGLICAFKPHLGCLVFGALLRRQWRFVGFFVLTFSVILAISASLYGWQQLFDYVRFLEFLGQRGERFYTNQSLNGLLNRLLDKGPILSWIPGDYPHYHCLVRWGTTIFSIFLMGLAFFWRKGEGKESHLWDLSVAIVSCTIASPVCWDHHYGFLLPILAVLLPAVSKYGGWRCAVSMILVFCLCGNYYPILNQLAKWPLWGVGLSYMFFGGLVLIWLLYRLRHLLLMEGRAPSRPFCRIRA